MHMRDLHSTKMSKSYHFAKNDLNVKTYLKSDRNIQVPEPNFEFIGPIPTNVLNDFENYRDLNLEENKSNENISFFVSEPDKNTQAVLVKTIDGDGKYVYQFNVYFHENFGRGDINSGDFKPNVIQTNVRTSSSTGTLKI